MTRAADKDRWILHADMDAFYASIEQRDDVSLRGRPVIVGGSSSRGVVAAASYEARVYGVRSAMPSFRARQLCPQAVFVAPDMQRYARVAGVVQAVFEEFTPEIEPLALDEAFLEVSDSALLFGGPLALARRLKARVREATALAVSVGVAPNKLVAKIACTLGKPDGLLLVPEDSVRWLLGPLPIRRLWGVGPVLAQTLERHGIRSIGELSAYDVAALTRILGPRARELVERARGYDPRPVESNRAPKSYGEENTFERDIDERIVVTATLTAHADAVARRLRRDGYRGRTVTLKIKLGQRHGARTSRLPESAEEPVYPALTRQRTLAAATDDGAIIRDVAVALWDEAAISKPVRLLGVSMSGLLAHEDKQLDLFPELGAGGRLGRALDRITERFGKHAIFRASPEPTKVSPSLRKKRGE
ncbi:MAG TPA: DNA polymerase IV [Polyangiaceae bacterium]